MPNQEMKAGMEVEARELGPKWVSEHPDQPENWTNGHWSDEAMVQFGAYVAAHILEKYKKEVEKA